MSLLNQREEILMAKIAEHFVWKGVKYEDVKVGEYVDMEAELFLRRGEKPPVVFFGENEQLEMINGGRRR